MASSIETTSTTTTLKNNGNTYATVDTNDDVTITNDLAVSGNVGINKAAPVTQLHIEGGGTSQPATTGTTPSAGTTLRIRPGNNAILDIGGDGTSGAWLQSYDQTGMQTEYPLLLNPNGGKVSVGSAGPVEALQVSGAIKVTGVITTDTANSGAMGYQNSKYRFISWGADASTKGAYGFEGFSSNGSASATYLSMDSNGNATFFGQLTQSKAGNTELMSLNTTGSVKGGIQCLSNATVRLGSTSNHPTEIVQQNTVRMIVHTNGNVTPGTDNSNELGGASYRWTAVYATNGSIQTSDAREKTKVRKFTDNEIAAAKDLSKEIGMFQWLEAIEKKGKDKARQHVGFTVQKAIEIMEGHDLDPMAYGFICYNEWEDEFVDTEVDGKEKRVQKLKAGDRYSFRQDQLNLFIARGIEARIAKLEEV